MKAKLFFTLAFALGLNAFAAESNLVKECKKECPKAKTEKEVATCIDSLEKGPTAAEFEKSKCFAAHDKHEKDAHAREDGHKH